jgi:hypothetical protein
MPYEVVLYRVDFFKMAAVAMETAKMLNQSNSGHHPTPLFWYLGFHGNAILNFINTPKASTHYGEYSYDVSLSLMKEIKKIKIPLFLFITPTVVG